MGNVKISAFSSQSDLSQIQGLAGYEGSVGSYTNARISGTQLQTWLQANLNFATASGTTNYVAKFTGASSLGDSTIQNDGSNISLNAPITTNHGVTIDGGGITGGLVHQFALFVDGQGSEYGFNSTANGVSATQRVGIQAQAIQSTSSNIGIKSIATGGTLALGGSFKASSGTSNYAIRLDDGTQVVGKFLKCMTASGDANWTDLPATVGTFTIASTAASTGDPLTIADDGADNYTLNPFIYAGTSNVGFVPTGGTSQKFLTGDGTWSAPDLDCLQFPPGGSNANPMISTIVGGVNQGFVRISGSGSISVDRNDDNGLTISSSASGTLSSVGLTMPSGFAVGSSPLTSNGTLAVTIDGGSASTFYRGDGSWATPTDTTYSVATNSTLGLIKIGATGLGTKEYPLLLNASDQAYVNVPWTDNNDNTTYDISITQETAGSNDSPNFTLTPSTGTADNIQFAGELPTSVTRSTDDIVIFSSRPFAGSSTTGHVPSSAAANQTTTFLRADGTWVAPSGSGSVTTVGVTNNINGLSISVTNATTTPDISFSVTGGTSGQYLDYQGNWSNLPSTSAAGSAGQIQYNDGSSGFTANAGLTYSTGSSLNTLVVGQQGSVPGVIEIKGADTTKGRLRLYCPDNSAPHYFELIGPAHGSASTYSVEVPNTGPGGTEKILSVQTWTSGTGLAELEWVDLPADTNTTYTMSTSTDGSDVDLKLDASTGTDTTIQFTAGSNMTITQSGGNNITFAAAGGGGGGFPSAVTAQTTATLSAAVDTFYTVTTSAGTADIVITLPTAASNSGKIIGVKYAAQNSVDDTVLIKTISSQTIDGTNRTTNGLPLASVGTYYELISDGTNWWIK